MVVLVFGNRKKIYVYYICAYVCECRRRAKNKYEWVWVKAMVLRMLCNATATYFTIRLEKSAL